MGDSRAFLQLFLTLTKIGYFISDQYPIGLLKVPKYRTISGHGVNFTLLCGGEAARKERGDSEKGDKARTA